jgi:hypothetical protein
MKFNYTINKIAFTGTLDRSAKTIFLTKPYMCQVKVVSHERAELYHNLTDKQAQVVRDNTEGLIIKCLSVE